MKQIKRHGTGEILREYDDSVVIEVLEPVAQKILIAGTKTYIVDEYGIESLDLCGDDLFDVVEV